MDIIKTPEEFKNWIENDFENANDSVMLFRENVKSQLAQITSIETAVPYLNKSFAVVVWYKKEGKDKEILLLAQEQLLRTQRIIGKLIQEGQQNGEILDKTANLKQGPEVTGSYFGKSLQDLGITKNQSSAYQAIADIPEEKFESFIIQGKASSKLSTAAAVQFSKSLFDEAEEISEEKYKWMLPYLASYKRMGKITCCAISPDDNEAVKAKNHLRSVDEKLSGNVWMAWDRINKTEIAWIQNIETDTFDSVLVLIDHVETETVWMQMLLGMATSICLMKNEERMAIYIGTDKKGFASNFMDYGICFNRTM